MGYSLVWTEGVTGEEGTVEGEGVCLEDSTGGRRRRRRRRRVAAAVAQGHNHSWGHTEPGPAIEHSPDWH